jgi:hypothetical protein
MADAPRRTDPDAPPKVPRWLKISGVVVGVLVLLFVILQLTGVGGQHGPGRHLPGGDTPPASVTGVHTAPAGGH